MAKQSYPIGLNFETGQCEEDLESKILHVCDRVRSITNPYIGNKRKILYNILQQMYREDPDFNLVLDLFSGSSCLGIALRLLNKRVISNDILYSSSLYAQSFTKIDGNPLTKNDEDLLFKSGGYEPISHPISKFSDRFTDTEFLKLLNIRNNLENLIKIQLNSSLRDEDKSNILKKKHFVLANLMLYITNRCFVGGRLNKGQIIADKDHRIGHQRNSGKEMSLRSIPWRSISGGNTNNIVMNMDAIEAIKHLPQSPDIAYIDPPYGGGQSDYAAMYDFLEKYSVYPEIKKGTESDPKNKFTKSEDYENNFSEMVQALDGIPVIIVSYNDSSWAGIDVIKNTIMKYRKKVKVLSLDYKYKYRKKSNSSGQEYIIIAK